MGKRLEASICRDFWMGRGRYSKAAMSKTMAYNYNPDKPRGEGDDVGASVEHTPSPPAPIQEA
jgi:hypothetical protein